MTAASYLSHAVAKPLFAGLTAAVADHYVMKNANIKGCAMFGAAVGGGIFAVSWVEPIVSPLFPTKTPLGTVGKALEGRAIEIICGSAAAYALNRFVLKNEFNSSDMMKKVGIVIAADLVGETVCELLLIGHHK